MEDAVFWYALSVVVLFIKMFLTSLYQGYHRISKLAFKNPEDARFVGREPRPEELPQVLVGQRVWLNDLENIPVFFALGIVYVLVGAPPDMAMWLFCTFTLARIAHSLAYISGIQPWRTLAYAVGLLCMFGMALQILLAVFKQM